MTDRFATTSPSLSGPAFSGFPVVPSDTVPLPETTRALYVGTGGDVSVLFASGASVTLKAIPGGTLLPIRASRVAATGTTAADIVGLV
ncbi:hypothetical protein [Ciceribacter sp. L1K22]|uniref:spike base protein, RCAP_Rcc01079 family n=1 Tax=Ciceribacter sp. L1K22 TaxID=2820275 RepID=UPI001ABDD306|nr:hypothetical protein [Ciceribacter sp. L1K22]MBO3758685.1 hypothetical protein [Ciceribacter sp. L1K22]